MASSVSKTFYFLIGVLVVSIAAGDRPISKS